MVAVSSDDLRGFAVELLTSAGAARTEAGVVADVMAWSELRGRGPQGLIWIEPFVRRLAAGTLVSPAPVTILDDRPGVISIDAGRGFGHAVTRDALDDVASRARSLGVAVAVIRNSTHFGPCGYYAERLADGGLLGLVATNAYPKVAPYGGRGPGFGTNPLGFGVPATDRRPIVGDLSTGALAGSRVRQAIESGTLLDPDQALDADGRPTRDPRALQNGGVMLPFGGPKGSALAILVEVLTSVAAGGLPPSELGSMFDAPAVAGTSHFLMAMDLDDGAADRMAAFARSIEATPPLGEAAVRMPGDAARDAASDAVGLDDDTVASLRRVASELLGAVPEWLS